MFAPLISDPDAGAGAVPDGAPTAVVAAGVPPVVGVVGAVLEHPAIAMAITTSTITMILLREIFKRIPPDMIVIPDNVPADTGIADAGIKWVIYIQLY